MQLTETEYFDFNPDNRKEDWAEKMVENFILNWKPLVDPERAKTNMQYLFGKQTMDPVKKMFTKNGDDANLDFIPLKVMEKIRNILTAETDKAGIRLECNALDPTATTQKLRDRELLTYSGDMAQFLNVFSGQLKLPPFNIANKKEAFSGNVEKFNELGLDTMSAEDLDHFFSTFYRLRHEIKAEEPLNYFYKYNECERMLPMFCNDIIAKKAIAMINYVCQREGAVKHKYIAPETVNVVMGDRPDCKDAEAIGYMHKVTVHEFIARMGDSFNYERDMPELIQAVNLANNQAYTGVGTDTKHYGTADKLCPAGTFYQYRIDLGYIEWLAQNATTFKYMPKNYHGNPRLLKVPYNDVAPNSKYTKINKYNQVTYKAYFLRKTVGTVKLFDYGPLPFQQIEGAQDERSNFSIVAIMDVGPSLVEVCIPHLNLLDKAKAKYEYLVNKAKAPGRLYNLDALLEVAAKMVKSGDTRTDIMGLLEMYAKSENELYTILNNRGENVGGNGVPHFDLKNGISEVVMEFRNIMMACMNDINDHVGISPLREAYSPDPRDGLRLQMQALDSSRNATHYVSRMLVNLFSDVSVKTLNYVQYIIQYKDIKAKPYEFLLEALGDQTVEELKSLGKVALHRYGVFVENFNSTYDRQEIKLLTQQALDKAQIRIEQKLLVDSIESPKRAAMVLAYETRRTERNNQKLAEQASKMRIEENNNKVQGELAIIDRKGEWDVKAKQMEGQLYKEAQIGAAEVRAGQQQTKQVADVEKQQQKVEAEKEMQQTEVNADAQAAPSAV